MNESHRSKTRKHQEHSTLSTNSHQNIGIRQTQKYCIYNRKGKL